MASLLLIGATGDVGRGIAAELLDAGYEVLAVGHHEGRLAELAKVLGHARLRTLVGSVADEAAAQSLLDKARTVVPVFDGVIVSVNLPMKSATLHAQSLDDVIATLRGNVGMHFVAAKAFIPAVRAGGLYLGIGGGMADFVAEGTGVMSMCQAAQRNMYRALALEYADCGLRFHELLVCSMVAGHSNRDKAHPKWITDREIGRYVLAILEQPASFTDTLLYLKSKSQVAELA